MESRVDKYQEYRTKLISDGDKIFDKTRKVRSETLTTTSALPVEEVTNALERAEREDEELLKLEKKKTILKFTFLGVFLSLLTIAIIIFAIYAFK